MVPTSITAERWRSVRTSLRETGGRFAELASSERNPQGSAIGTWSAGETAAHVATVTSMYTALLSSPENSHPFPEIAQRVRSAALDEIAALNDFTLRHMTERDPRVLGQRIRDDIEVVLDATADLDPAEPVGWLGGARLPVAGWCAHLLNELLIHGHDIAGSAGTRWEVPQPDAALAFELFLVALLSNDTGKLLSHEPIRRDRVAVEFRSRYTSPVVLTAHDGRITATASAREIDVHVFFQPAGLMLILFGRLGKLRAALTGRAVVWGRRPWLLLAFLHSVRFP
ncbi:maleylpyruvate isomerase N-terminal domain-containing protein [Saccharopolyspora sp. NPDC050389]|uniref:maleylpyruvate isomerase N-terminal domain-containing protein n=1 Tax=Saccharopolyspora sp. NPDC050389 TaxID=3155516 RepID=UPI0033BFCB0E